MKKLVFCFDGTSNDPMDAGDFFTDSSISNVLKLYVLMGGKLNLENNKDPQMPGQHSFYYSGIGTRGGWVSQTFNAMFSPANGDMEDILEKAKKDLESYQKGDEIFVFGFSRGAAIARMFAAKYVGQDKPVKFLGVFDTVSAIIGKSLNLSENSLPESTILFENGTIGKNIEKAVHLVSIDEKRLAFQPTLFNKDNRVEEIWFAGVHSDIGGGYWFDGLSDIALKFMMDKAKEQGVTFLDAKDVDYAAVNADFDEGSICADDVNIKPLPTGIMHEQIRAKAISSQTLAPRRVRVNVDDKPSTELPIIHESVQQRFREVASYRPYALRNVRYRLHNSPNQERHGIADLVREEEKTK